MSVIRAMPRSGSASADAVKVMDDNVVVVSGCVVDVVEAATGRSGFPLFVGADEVVVVSGCVVDVVDVVEDEVVVVSGCVVDVVDVVDDEVGRRLRLRRRRRRSRGRRSGRRLGSSSTLTLHDPSHAERAERRAQR